MLKGFRTWHPQVLSIILSLQGKGIPGVGDPDLLGDVRRDARVVAVSIDVQVVSRVVGRINSEILTAPPPPWCQPVSKKDSGLHPGCHLADRVLSRARQDVDGVAKRHKLTAEGVPETAKSRTRAILRNVAIVCVTIRLSGIWPEHRRESCLNKEDARASNHVLVASLHPSISLAYARLRAFPHNAQQLARLAT